MLSECLDCCRIAALPIGGFRVASEAVHARELIRLGDDFELDRTLRELRRSGRVVKLERIPMEVLLLLIEQRGQLVTRAQIVERVWGAGVFLDTDNSINGAIRKIRQVLGDHPERPRFIQTVTGTGYRLIAPLTDAAAAKPAARPELQSPSSKMPIPRPSPRRSLITTGVALGLMAIVGGYAAWSATRSRSPASTERVMLAVLPFENLTGDAGQDYFSEGLTEEMITQLGRLEPQRLGVIARTSVIHYKQHQVPVEQVGRELGVQYVLEGSVRRDSDRVRIAAQLIQVQDQTHLWAQNYDRQLEDLLQMQAEIAHEIADEIQLTLGQERRAPRVGPVRVPASYEDYDLYLKGRFFWNKRNPEGFRQAVAWFEQAVEKDPNYARAYAGLADSYAMMSGYGLVRANDYMPKARAAALTAMQIDDSLAEAHSSLAVIVQNYDWDWQKADKEFRRAIQLNPNYATAHQWYAESLAFQGRFDDALAESERARQLDPLSLIIAADNGAILYFSRQYDRAIERFRAVLDRDPGFTRAHLVIAAYVQKGEVEAALADLNNWRRTTDGPWTWAWEAYVYGRAGENLKARRALQQLRQVNRSWQLDPEEFLDLAYAGLDDKDKWLSWLQKACQEHSSVLADIKVDPIYDPLRSDPRFQDVLRHIGLSH